MGCYCFYPYLIRDFFFFSKIVYRTTRIFILYLNRSKAHFFVQVDFIEPFEQTPANSSLLLTLTDGITTVQGITIDSIPELK